MSPEGYDLMFVICKTLAVVLIAVASGMSFQKALDDRFIIENYLIDADIAPILEDKNMIPECARFSSTILFFSNKEYQRKGCEDFDLTGRKKMPEHGFFNYTIK